MTGFLPRPRVRLFGRAMNTFAIGRGRMTHRMNSFVWSINWPFLGIISSFLLNKPPQTKLLHFFNAGLNNVGDKCQTWLGQQVLQTEWQRRSFAFKNYLEVFLIWHPVCRMRLMSKSLQIITANVLLLPMRIEHGSVSSWLCWPVNDDKPFSHP